MTELINYQNLPELQNQNIVAQSDQWCDKELNRRVASYRRHYEKQWGQSLRQDMIDWFNECNWADDPDFDEYTDEELVEGIERHVSGGMKQFMS